MSLFELYLVFNAGSIGRAMAFMSFIVVMVSAFSMFYIRCGVVDCYKSTERSDESAWKMFNWIKNRLLMPAAILLLVSVFIPSSDALKSMTAGYFVTNIENIESLPPNIVEAANKFLADYSVESKAE